MVCVWFLIHRMPFAQYQQNKERKNMKKILLIGIMSLIFNASSVEAKCEGGTVVRGILNNHEYCVSSTGMTWWSAFAWCEFQERHLATLTETCIEWNGVNASTMTCPNLTEVDTKRVWSANFNMNHNGLAIYLSTGQIKDNHTRADSSLSALCY